MHLRTFVLGPVLGLLVISLFLPAAATDVSGLYYMRDEDDIHHYGHLRRDPHRGDSSWVTCSRWIEFLFDQTGNYYGSNPVTSVDFHIWMAHHDPLDPDIEITCKRDGQTVGGTVLFYRESVISSVDGYDLFKGTISLDEDFIGDEIYDFSFHILWWCFLRLPVRDLHLSSFIIVNYEDGAGDQDGDLLTDHDELFVYFTNPYDMDTDDDGRTDAEEVLAPKPSDPNDYHDTTLYTIPTFVPPPVLYVDDFSDDPIKNGTHEHPFDNIQQGLQSAGRFWEVIVRDGTYQGASNRNLDFAGRAATVRSANGPEGCVIDCQDQGRGFLLDSQEGSDSVVEGFTIENGSPGPTADGGAIHLGQGVGAVVRNCILRDNQARRGGGVFACDNDATIERCWLIGNEAEDDGGGAFFEGFTSAMSPQMLDCLLRDNRADRGAGLAVMGSGPGSVLIRNCTATQDTASVAGGGLYCSGLDTEVRNSVFWDDVAPSGAEMALDPLPLFPYSLSVAYSDVEGGPRGVSGQIGAGTLAWGPGNLDSAPLFCGEPDYPFHLPDGSPCQDAGDPDFVPLEGETDLDGHDRVVSDIVDMGAYEYSAFGGGGWYGAAPVSLSISENQAGQDASDDAVEKHNPATLVDVPSMRIWPNPVRLSASAQLDLSPFIGGDVALYDVAGRAIRLLSSQARSSGPQTLIWNCRDDDGREVEPGVYYLRSLSGNDHHGVPIIVVR